MDFNKNEILIHNICQVQIKSISDVVNIPDYLDFYATPSRITLSKRSRYTENGVLHNKNLSLFYPGLSPLDFDKFSELLKGEYLVLVKDTNNDVYQLCSSRYPMQCNTSFNKNHSVNFTSDSPLNIKFVENQPADGIDSDGFQYTFNFFLS